MRCIELGGVTIHMESTDETVTMLQELLRPLSNKEVAAMLGIAERTVARWKQTKRLPTRDGGQVFMADMVSYLIPKKGELKDGS